MEERQHGLSPPWSPPTPQDPQEEAMDVDIPEDTPPDWERQIDNLSKKSNLQSCLFHCLGDARESTSTHQDSYMRNMTIIRLRNLHLQDQQDIEPVISLFGSQIMRESIIYELDHLINMALMAFNRLEKESDTSPKNPGAETRKEVRSLLFNISDVLHRTDDSEGEYIDDIQKVLFSLQAFVAYIGRIHELVGLTITTYSGSRNKELSGQHSFHYHLDVYWSITELLHVITARETDLGLVEATFTVNRNESPENCDLIVSNDDIFQQWTHALLWDLVLVAIKRFNNITSRDWDRISPFHCSCFKELYLMVKFLLQERQQKMAKQSFWVQLSSILMTLNAQTLQDNTENEALPACDVFCIPPRYQLRDPVGFCWWFISHLAPLYMYDERGIYRKEPQHENNDGKFFFLNALMKKSLLLPEATLRGHMVCCLRIATVWGGDNNLIETLWNHFYKKMNDLFKDSGSGLRGYTCDKKSAMNVYNTCQDLEARDKPFMQKIVETENSYRLFLRLLALHLGKSGLKGSENKDWNRLKGRFFSKFHARKVLELTDIGIENLTYLYLILASVTDLDITAEKLCELYDGMLRDAKLDLKRRAVVWRGAFSLILLLVKEKRDVGFVANKLSSSFGIICSEIGRERDSMRTSGLWDLVRIYLESTKDVFDCSLNLDRSEHKLICNDFLQLCSLAPMNHLEMILTFIKDIILRQRVVLDSSTVRTIGQTDYLWTTCYPFIKTHSTTQTPPASVAEIAAQFASLYLNYPPSSKCDTKETLDSLVSYFGWNEKVNVNVSCGFLSETLLEAEIWARISSTHPDYQLHVIKGWFRCGFHLTKDSLLDVFTSSVAQLSEFQEVFKLADMSPGSSYVQVNQNFIQALGKSHSKLQNFKEKMMYKQKVITLIGDVTGAVGNVVKTSPNSGHIKKVYVTAGHLVAYCSKILYAKNSPHALLPKILDTLVVPRSFLDANKSIPPHQLAAIGDSLHLYCIGLSRLDKSDPYIQRKIKDIITTYLPRFNTSSSKAGASQVHPLLVCLHGTYNKGATEEDVSFRKQFLQVLHTEYLNPNSSTLNWGSSTMILGFLIQLCDKTHEPSQIAKDAEILFPGLLVMTLSDNVQIRDKCRILLKVILAAMKKSPNEGISDTIQGSIRVFVSQQIRVHQNRALGVVDLLRETHPALVTTLIPSITGAITDWEKKRGVGIDRQLRLQYGNILRELGEPGRDELKKLVEENL